NESLSPAAPVCRDRQARRCRRDDVRLAPFGDRARAAGGRPGQAGGRPRRHVAVDPGTGLFPPYQSRPGRRRPPRAARLHAIGRERRQLGEAVMSRKWTKFTDDAQRIMRKWDKAMGEEIPPELREPGEVEGSDTPAKAESKQAEPEQVEGSDTPAKAESKQAEPEVEGSDIPAKEEWKEAEPGDVLETKAKRKYKSRYNWSVFEQLHREDPEAGPESYSRALPPRLERRPIFGRSKSICKN